MFHFFQYDAMVLCTFMVCCTIALVTRRLWEKR